MTRPHPHPIRERAFAKVNLLLHVGPRRPDGLHEICSLFASIDLADELTIREAAEDSVRCPGVEGENLAMTALRAFRDAGVDELPPLAIEIDKRIPVAAGLGGGSADAAAVLRAANALAGRPLGPGELRTIAASVGADVPSQVEPRAALVTGAGEVVEPIDLPPAALVLVPQPHGLETARVFAEADRIGSSRARLEPERVRTLAAEPLTRLAPALENDLQGVVLALRPELERPLAELRSAGALAALVTGSGPTVFGVFPDEAHAREGAARVPSGRVSMVRSP
jgi:4-diphosphocytidyl-2-C-methyl-D-erythritol kinase